MKTLKQQLRKYAEQAVKDAKANPHVWFSLCYYFPEARDDSKNQLVFGDGFTVGFDGDYEEYDEDAEETVVNALVDSWATGLWAAASTSRPKIGRKE